MLKTIIHVMTIALICIVTSSCGKEQPEIDRYEVCGTYSLNQIRFFSTHQVDLNGDGEENENFLEEFKHLDGYSEYLSDANVYMSSSSKNQIVIDFYIPYHDVRIENNGINDYGCGYIDSSLIGRLDGNQNFEDHPLFFVNLSGPPVENRIGECGIDNANIKEFGVYGQMKIYVYCTIYDSDFTPHEGTLLMLFMKNH